MFIEEALTTPALRKCLEEKFALECERRLNARFAAIAQNNVPSRNHPIVEKPIHRAWFISSDWQERSARLYAAAAEVAQQITK